MLFPSLNPQLSRYASQQRAECLYIYIYVYVKKCTFYTYATFYIGGRNKFMTQRQKVLLVLPLFDLGYLHFLRHHMHVIFKTKHFLHLLMSNKH